MKNILTILFFVLGYEVFSQPPIFLDNRQEIKIENQHLYFEDFARKKTGSDIGNTDFENSFKKAPRPKSNISYTTANVWLKCKIENTSDKNWLLEINKPSIDTLEFFLVQNNKIISHFLVGDHFPISTYPIKDRIPIFPLNLAKNQVYSIYLRGNSTEDLDFKPTFWEGNKLYEHLVRRDIPWGIFFGFVLVISLYNLFLWLTIRDQTYLFYIIYVLGFGMLQASLYGFGFQYAWGNHPFNEKAHIIFLGVWITFLTIFSVYFLDIFKTFPKLKSLIIRLSIVWFMVLAYMIFTFNSQTYKLLIITSIAGLIFQYYYSIKLLLQGNRSVRFYLLAMVAFSLALVIILLKNLLDIFPGDFYLKLGSMIEMLLFSVALGDKYRYIKLEQIRQQKVRNDIASNLHDDLAASLSSLTMFSELNRMKSQKTDPKSKEIFENISRRSREMMKQVREAVWEINPKNDESDEWLDRMINYARETLDSKQIDLKLNIKEGIEKLKLPIDDRRNIYLFFKEAINNAAKYSEATLVEVDFFKKNGNVFLEIKDNGKGFDENAIIKGNGLLNFEKRAEELKGKVEVISDINKGTEINLWFPISH